MRATRNVTKPRIDATGAAQVLRDLYGIEAEVTELPAERDRNFVATAEGGARFVLKVAHVDTVSADLEVQDAAIRHVAATAPELRIPVPRTSLSGAPFTTATIDGAAHVVRVLTFVEGATLASLRPKPESTLRAVGAAARRLSLALSSLDHPHVPDGFVWDLRAADDTVLGASAAVGADRRPLLLSTVARAHRALGPIEGELAAGTIHGDLNDHNVIVHDVIVADTIGIIDFGDLHRSYSVAEVAIAAAYASLGLVDPVEAIGSVVAGAHEVAALSDAEIEAIMPLVMLRLCVSVAMAAEQTALQPDNDYLAVSQTDAWATLERLAVVPLYLAQARLRAACGLEPCRRSADVSKLLEANEADLHPVLDVPMDGASVCVIDWSVTSPEAAHPAIAPPMADQTRAVEEAMATAAATVGLGRYGEPRLVYSTPEFAVATNRGPSWRTVHLGVDLSCAPGTPVLALTDGVVARVDDEAIVGGYGPVITLRHEPEDGPAFFTLYGHLDGATVAVKAGQHVLGGEHIAAVGSPPHNGNWPPHLHFQLMTDLLDLDGPFPGVALPDEWATWSSLCPSPAAALRLSRTLVEAVHVDDEDIAARRRALLPPSLSTSYAQPLVAVRGFGSYLYDGWGRAHVDCVNNVAHVGHEHPHVVEALRRQATLLNTNSRYPHPERLRYVERLAGLFPDPLDTVFLVCTGSEANDLALRIARTVTARTDVAVLDGAYHGHTSDLIAASPYKHNGPGGQGTPPTVHVVPLPDPYRSPHGADTNGHLGDVERIVDGVGGRLAAFIAEPIPGVAGQVVLPEGYLRGAFDAVKRAGGLCIADEVQVGLGRVGSHWWAFAREGAVPDIVTLGKPLGNGHPVAAVVTSRAIADAFANGMEYFNTFGGNPVSCAVGNAVLDVLHDESLLAHAATMGAVLLDDFAELADRHEVIGDVRGAGLFLGMELVADRTNKRPAPGVAQYVADRARELGVLLSVDGLLHNVLKFKPPMVFGEPERTRLVEVLDEVLAEDGAQPSTGSGRR